MLQFAEETFDQIALAVKHLAEARLPFAIGFGGYVGHRALALDQVADAARIVGLVSKHDGARDKPVEQSERGGSVVRLTRRQAEPDRETLRIDDRVDLGREAAPAATETMISTPLFRVAACWCAWTEVLSIIWMSPS